ncbi:hypothetical protein [Butyrivibrio sp. WCE2006]|uniref:hypothetical protein n=1 Tax=Butyrivibrio sp. WCE2006 TaxID=1410611 RepID=UPI000A690037|nr:hypothetical protein [Butyrivibrio sp. WCE2006]
MNVTTYVKMNKEQLAKEIERQKKKIKLAQETIKLLEKLQIAESMKIQNGFFKSEEAK